MASLVDEIEIDATPTKIYKALVQVFSSKESYRNWHKDHVSCKWISGKPFEEGSILYVEENLHGKLHKLRMFLTKIEPKIKIEYKFLFPTSMICHKGSYIIKPKAKKNSVLTTTLSFNFGRLFLKLNSNRVKAIARHMKEEGENLKNLSERE